MNKKQFIELLGGKLARLSKENRNHYLDYYEELIEDMKEEGLSEEEALIKIGNPSDVALQIIEQEDTIILKIPSTGNKIINWMLIILGAPLWGSLLAAAAVLFLSFLLILMLIPFTIGVIAFATCSVGIVGTLASPFVMTSSLLTGLFQLGSGLISLGLFIPTMLLTIRVCRWFSFVWNQTFLTVKNVFKKKEIMSWR